MEVLIGTSGWSYREWEGVFYPRGEKAKLTFYSKVFDTVEVDSTFYAFPSQGFAKGAARNTPDGFLFAAKLPKLITHDKALAVGKGVKEDVFRFLHLLSPLLEAGKLGPLLVQLPPGFAYGKGLPALKAFLEVVPTDIRFAVEFRNKSWLGKSDALDLLRSHNVANAVVDEPLLPANTEPTADFAFIRWHGRGKRPWYNYRYEAEELDSWTPKVKELATKVKRVYGHFNNHFRGFAVENSLQMLTMLGTASESQSAVLADVSSRIDFGRDAGQEAL